MTTFKLDVALGLTPCSECVGSAMLRMARKCPCTECRGKDYKTPACRFEACPFKGELCEAFDFFDDEV